MELSDRQYKLLAILSKGELRKSELSPQQQRDIEYLGKLGCIEYQGIFPDENSFRSIDTIILIQPKGDAIYRTYVRQRNRWLIPLLISVAALLISVVALYCSARPINIYLNTNKAIDSSMINGTVIRAIRSGKSGYLECNGIPLSQNGHPSSF